MTDPIIKTVDVACSPAEAFEVFAGRISSWWPLDTHAVSAAVGKVAQGATIEPRVGGAVFETTHDGGHAVWGEVLVYEPGKHLAMTWHPGYDATKATRVDVRFEASGARTRVTLTHSGWEIWGAEAKAKRENYTSGWDFVLGHCFAEALSEA